MKVLVALVLLAVVLPCSLAQPFQPGTGFGPAGNLRTQDKGGPYKVAALSVQANEVKAGIAYRTINDVTDRDIVNFLVNVECLEGQFDTYGAFGFGFINNLTRGGPTPIGARKANLSAEVEPFMQEIALSEQGHALFTRQAGSNQPCPAIDYTTGFNEFFGAAYGLRNGTTIKDKFGSAFDPFMNDETFLLSVLSLEELGATGNKGLAGIISNPVIAAGVRGLATSATAFAAIERKLLWERRNNTVPPFGETVQQVFSRISALRDSLDGKQLDDQGLVNTDPRNIAVPDMFINMFPTDIRGCTFERTPGMNINVLTLGNPEGKGVFFPDGLLGKIKHPGNVSAVSSGLQDFPKEPGHSAHWRTTHHEQLIVDTQETVAAVGKVPPPITGSLPAAVPGETDLSQALTGPRDNGTYLTRGYLPAGSGTPFNPNITS